jgi:hypothetical protein
MRSRPSRRSRQAWARGRAQGRARAPPCAPSVRSSHASRWQEVPRLAPRRRPQAHQRAALLWWRAGRLLLVRVPVQVQAGCARQPCAAHLPAVLPAAAVVGPWPLGAASLAARQRSEAQRQLQAGAFPLQQTRPRRHSPPLALLLLEWQRQRSRACPARPKRPRRAPPPLLAPSPCPWRGWHLVSCSPSLAMARLATAVPAQAWRPAAARRRCCGGCPRARQPRLSPLAQCRLGLWRV